MVAVHLHGKRKEVAKVYKALVLDIDNEDVNLRYMAKSGSMYCWPDEDDESWQGKNDIICVIPHPAYLMRDLLEFPEETLESVKTQVLQKDHTNQVQFA